LILVGTLVPQHDRRVVDRFRSLSRSEASHGEHARQYRGMLRLLMPRMPEVAEVFVPNDEATRTRLQSQLSRAGIYAPWALKVYFMVKLAAMVIPLAGCLGLVVSGTLPLPLALMSGSLGGVLGMFLPGVWIRRLQVRRQSVLRRSLPDFLDLIIACLEAGLSIQASLKQVTDELRVAHPIFSSEMSIVLRELDLGRNVDQGLAHFAERTGVEELRTLSAFVQQAAKFGTTMADAMRQLSEMLRMQRELRAEELAQKAAVKILFPTLLFIFPTVFVVLAGPAAIQIREGLKGVGNHESSPMVKR
jgi:tight adherence protein C